MSMQQKASVSKRKSNRTTIGNVTKIATDLGEVSCDCVIFSHFSSSVLQCICVDEHSAMHISYSVPQYNPLRDSTCLHYTGTKIPSSELQYSS